MTIVAAIIGGGVFGRLGLPVPWLAGSMLTVVGLAMAGAPVRLSQLPRDFGLMVAGVSLGSTITPEALQALARYPLSLLGLFASVTLTVLVSRNILERMFGWDRATAVLSSVPGALSMVMALAAASSGDMRRIAVVQALRLFMLVAVLPLALSATAQAVAPRARLEISAAGMAVLFVAAFLVVAAMGRLRFANPLFLGGMLTGTALHVSGLVPGELPQPLTTIGMVLIGVFAGLRFQGTTPRMLIDILPAALVVLAVALALSVGFSLPVHWLTGLKLAEVLVAFAPGGVEAMIMMGAAMGLDTLYIGTHHVLRAVGLNLVAPLFARQLPPVEGPRAL